ncbi:hypothetical protein E2C01_011918 [Portunus trituberculatus]|uniref:Uncharacterized protein n=1 Tax=Portunus trituberculatus TaxID=210409 RepID=A0A5B7DCM3_PORTR|nr:hypothetical protein [Portunus trituberculatus]
MAWPRVYPCRRRCSSLTRSSLSRGEANTSGHSQSTTPSPKPHPTCPHAASSSPYPSYRVESGHKPDYKLGWQG